VEVVAMTRLATLILVLLGYLAGGAEAMDGEAAGRFLLELVGLLVTAFLFYLAFSGAIRAFFPSKWRRKRSGVERRGVSEVPSAPAGSRDEAKDPASPYRGRPDARLAQGQAAALPRGRARVGVAAGGTVTPDCQQSRHPMLWKPQGPETRP
jgi:hypothetical protein